MKDKKSKENFIDYFHETYHFPFTNIYTSERLRSIHEYAEWLKEHGLKAAPSGYPDNFKKKKVTKPKGRSPRIAKRNKAIYEDYRKLHRTKGLQTKVAIKKIAKKYGLKYSTIETIIKKG